MASTGSMSLEQTATQEASRLPCFSAGAELRPQQDGEWDELEATSIDVSVLSEGSVVTVVNKFLKQLQTSSQEGTIDEATPVVVKEHDAKFSFKATVFRGDEFCMFKTRLFAAEPQGTAFVAEFVYRRGDQRLFNSVFAMAISLFKDQEKQGIVTSTKPRLEATIDLSAWEFVAAPQAMVGVSAWEFAPAPALPTQGGCGGAAAEAAALVDTAGFAEGQDLQVEAARAIARAACDSEQRRLLCTDRFFGALRLLLQSDALEVLWPAARALKELAALPESRIFLDGELCKELDRKASSSETPLAVQQLLSKLLSAEKEEICKLPSAEKEEESASQQHQEVAHQQTLSQPEVAQQATKKDPEEQMASCSRPLLGAPAPLDLGMGDFQEPDLLLVLSPQDKEDLMHGTFQQGKDSKTPGKDLKLGTLQPREDSMPHTCLTGKGTGDVKRRFAAEQPANIGY